MSEITVKLPRFVKTKPLIFDILSAMSGSPRAEVLSGITVALALVPEAVAFAFVANVPRSSGSTPRSSCACSRRSSGGAPG